MSKKINLGCGNDVKSGWVNVDMVWGKGITVFDLNQYWKLPDSCADEVLVSHIYEHINDAVFFLKELIRICKPDAKVVFKVPSFRNVTAWADPTHKRAVSITFFTYYVKRYGFTLIKHNHNFLKDLLGFQKEYVVELRATK